MEESNQNQFKYYEIRIEGHLDDAHSNEFGDLRVNRLPHGQTLISGRVQDQAALFGILLRIRDMGIPLISVSRKDEIENKIK